MKKHNDPALLIVIICTVLTLILLVLIISGQNNKTNESNNTVAKARYSEAEDERASTPYGTYTFRENGYLYKVIVKSDETAQLIIEKGAGISPVEGDIAYGSWDENSDYNYIKAEFRVKEIITDPFNIGKWRTDIGYYNCYFREGYVYHSYDEVKAKDPTHRVPYTKTN